jgi:hypothetical protein
MHLDKSGLPVERQRHRTAAQPAGLILNVIDWKVMAFLSMLIDHIGAVLYPDHIFFRLIGRLAMPLFCLLVGVGSARTKNLQNYQARLLMLAVISQIPFDLAFGFPGRLNVCFTLSIGLFLWSGSWVVRGLLVLILLLIPMDYGLTGALSVVVSCWGARYGLRLRSDLRSRLWFGFYPIHLFLLYFVSLCY